MIYNASIERFYPNSHSCIYLCIKYKTTNYYKCIKFDNFEMADNFYKNKCTKTKIESSTMMPVCKYVPNFVQHHILDYKLKRFFIKTKIF